MSDAQSEEGDLEALQGPAPPCFNDAEARTAIDDLLTFVEKNASKLEDAEKCHETLLVVCDAIRKLATRRDSQRHTTDYSSMDL